MIFVTVGTHEQPFNRLIQKVDELKRDGVIKDDVIIQTGFSTYEPKYCQWSKLIPYQQMVKNVADLFRLYKDARTNKIIREDFLYIHLQLRKMKFDSHILSEERFKILENRFELIENSDILDQPVESLTIRKFNTVRRHAISFRFIRLQVKWKINKLKRIVRKNQ